MIRQIDVFRLNAALQELISNLESGEEWVALASDALRLCVAPHMPVRQVGNYRVSKSPAFLLFLPVSEMHYLNQPWLVRGEAMIGYAVFHAEDVPSCIARVVLKEVPLSQYQKVRSWCLGIMALVRFVVARILNPQMRNRILFLGKPRAIGTYFRVIHSCDPNVKKGEEWS